MLRIIASLAFVCALLCAQAFQATMALPGGGTVAVNIPPVVPEKTPALTVVATPVPVAEFAQRQLLAVTASHSYSTISPFSANRKYVALKSGVTTIVDAATGATAYAGRPGNVSGLGIMWDGRSDDVYYFVDGLSVKKHVLSANATTVVYTHPAAITNGGTGDVSADNLLAFTSEIR